MRLRGKIVKAQQNASIKKLIAEIKRLGAVAREAAAEVARAEAQRDATTRVTRTDAAKAVLDLMEAVEVLSAVAALAAVSEVT